MQAYMHFEDCDTQAGLLGYLKSLERVDGYVLLFNNIITMALSRLRGCTGCTVLLLFAYSSACFPRNGAL